MTDSSAQPNLNPGSARGVGRPRHYNDEAERKLLFEAAFKALAEQGLDFTVAKVMTEAGVSTRSFYRQFPSKGALLRAMYIREAEAAGQYMQARIAVANNPVAAIGAWVEEIFDLVSNPRRAQRASVLRSILPGVGLVGRSTKEDDETDHGWTVLVNSLVAAVEDGVECGDFVCDDSRLSAELVASAVFHAAGLGTRHNPPAAATKRNVTGFCLRALGWQDSYQRN